MTTPQRHLTNLTDRTAALAAAKHADRAAALAAAQVEIGAAADHELDALRKQIAAVEQSRSDNLAAAAAAVERTRVARGSALLGELFASGPDSLPICVARFRIDPTRAGALAIHVAWLRFAERARTELGGELSTQALGALFIDDILATQPALGGAIGRLSDPQFDCGDGAIHALHVATRPNSTPGDVQAALERFENLVLNVANQHRDTPPSSEHAEMHGLRRAHATHGDLVKAREALGQQQGARRQAEFERSYKAPAPFDALRARFASAGLLPPQ